MWAAAFVLLLVAAGSACLYLACQWILRSSENEKTIIMYEVAET